MEAIDLNSEMHEAPVITGLGERLVASREALGLALGDVVQVLRLPAATLQALESDCHEKLPAPVFVRGYLRAYARLLEMDGDALVADYNRLAAPPTPVLAPVPEVRRPGPGRDLYIKGTAALIVVTLVAMLGSWWYLQTNQDVPVRSTTATAEVESPASPATVPASSQTDISNPDTAQQPPAGAVAVESDARVASETPPAESAAEAGPVPSRVNDSPAITHTAVAELPVAPLASEREGLVRASRAPAGADVIDIWANAESWAEVVDANGYQLLYYLLRPGLVYRLQGQGPFQVFLGNAPVVELSLNRERFDHAPFRRRNSTARFTVDVR